MGKIPNAIALNYWGRHRKNVREQVIRGHLQHKPRIAAGTRMPSILPVRIPYPRGKCSARELQSVEIQKMKLRRMMDVASNERWNVVRLVGFLDRLEGLA